MARLLVVLVTLVSLASGMRVLTRVPTASAIRSSSSIASLSSTCGAGELISAQLQASRTQQSAIAMAVPKKRQSKMKTRQRKANWFAKARRQATLALSRAKSANYNPLEDPKYAFTDADDEDDDEDDDEEE